MPIARVKTHGASVQVVVVKGLTSSVTDLPHRADRLR